MKPVELNAADLLIRLAILEDLGDVGDVTSMATIPADAVGRARFVMRSDGVIAGLPLLPRIARFVDVSLVVTLLEQDGRTCPRGTVVAEITGPMRSVLSAERTMLNFMQRLSGIATQTRRYVDAITGTKAVILDTRKTTPGWRRLEKYAVRTGGGVNHRIGLFDAILIKDNHLAALAPRETAVRRAIESARAMFPGKLIEIEVDSLDQLRQALPLSPEIVLLDNMTADLLRTAVQIRDVENPAVLLEASGGVNMSTVRAIAETGVDRISIGAVTHSAPALDIALDYAG